MKLLYQIFLLAFIPFLIVEGVSYIQIETLLDRLDQETQVQMKEKSEHIRDSLDKALAESDKAARFLADTDDSIYAIEHQNRTGLNQKMTEFHTKGIDFFAVFDVHGILLTSYSEDTRNNPGKSANKLVMNALKSINYSLIELDLSALLKASMERRNHNSQHFEAISA